MNSRDDEEEDEHSGLPRFGPLRSVIPYSCFGGLPLGEVWWMNKYRGERPREDAQVVFLTLCLVLWSRRWFCRIGSRGGPPLWCTLASIYSDGPGPLPLSQWWEGIPQWPNSKGDRITSLPCPKVVFACKVAVDDAEVGSAMTSVLLGSWSWSCCTGMETFGGRFENPRTSLPPLQQRGNCTAWCTGARLSFHV